MTLAFYIIYRAGKKINSGFFQTVAAVNSLVCCGSSDTTVIKTPLTDVQTKH